MIRVEVTNEPINTRRVTNRNTGNQVDLREQNIYVHNGHSYPTRMRITLDRDQAPFAPGIYSLGPRSIVQGQYGEPAIGRSIELVPVPATATKVA
jgi:hypothetical protein